MGVDWVVLTVLIFGLLELASESAAFQSPSTLAPRNRLQLNKTQKHAHNAPTPAPASLASPRISRSRVSLRRRTPLLQLMGGGAEGDGGGTQPTCSTDAQQEECPKACCPAEAENLPFFSPDSSDYPLDYFGESTRGDLLPVPEIMGSGSFMEGDELQDVCDKLGKHLFLSTFLRSSR